MAGCLNTQHYNVFGGGQIQKLLRLRITRAPPWYFQTIIQSCLLPWLWPPITNPLTVKLPLSIQWTLALQSCLPGGISSLLAPSPPRYCAGCVWPSKHSDVVGMHHCRNKGALWGPYTPSIPPKNTSASLNGYCPSIWCVSGERKASCGVLGGHFCQRWWPWLWRLWCQLCFVLRLLKYWKMQ